MSTFNPPADIAQITLAKSSDVNAVKAATAIAFGLLPSETKLQRGTVNFAVDTGTANTYAVALDSSITSYTDGLQVVFRPLNDNTGSATINLNSLGAKSIRLTDSEPIQAGDISAGAVIDVRYSTSTGFFHLTPNSAIYAHDAGVSATAAAASASTASTQATNAASSASSASTSASSASTSATNAATSASSMTASVASCTASQTAAATSATNAATSASGASTSATTATTQATNASASASTATTQATNASTSASTASTQATNAANSASTASTQATAAGTSATNAATSATNAATSATNASTSASTATTQAGIATTQAGLATTNGAAQVALATTQATNAATSATNAASSASAASTSASNASASASTATTQASNASTSATNAANSATAAAASYDSFDDRYLGAKSSNPTVDNDGNALLTGALYWNTTSSEMRVYSGSAWITSYLPASGYLALSGGTMAGAITFAAGQTIANLSGGSVGTIPYQTASGTTAMLAVGTSGQVLTSNGTSAPSWQPPFASGGTVTSVAALTLGTTGTDVSSSVVDSTTTPVITLNIPTASASNRGALSSSDWSTFNGKYSTGGALGTPSSGTLSSCTVDGTNGVGYINIPQNSQSADYTLVAADAGKHIFHPATDTTARTFTIPANGSVAYPIGTELTIINQFGAGTITLTSADTLRLITTGTAGFMSVIAGNKADLIKVTSTEWLVSGATYVPPVIGQAYGGGFYAGKINDSGTQYYLIVAPKASGENSSSAWGIYGSITGITSVINGPTNSASLAALGASYQAAVFAEGLTIGGYSDWYLPAKNELEVLYYFLKPTTDTNDTASGSNANAVSPEPISTNYTSGSPAQTSSGIGFRTGETNAFSASYYWSSTERNDYRAWRQDFTSGYQPDGGKHYSYYVRAVRRIAV